MINARARRAEEKKVTTSRQFRSEVPNQKMQIPLGRFRWRAQWRYRLPARKPARQRRLSFWRGTAPRRDAVHGWAVVSVWKEAREGLDARVSLHPSAPPMPYGGCAEIHDPDAVDRAPRRECWARWMGPDAPNDSNFWRYTERRRPSNAGEIFNDGQHLRNKGQESAGSRRPPARTSQRCSSCRREQRSAQTLSVGDGSRRANSGLRMRV